jgi:hypothetical protein
MLKVTIVPNPCSILLREKTTEEKDFVIKNEGDSCIWFSTGKMEWVHRGSLFLSVSRVCDFIDPGDFSTLRLIASYQKGPSNKEVDEDPSIVTANLPIHFYDEYPGSCKYLSECYENVFLKPPVKTELLVFEVSVPAEESLGDLSELILMINSRNDPTSDSLSDLSSDSSTDSGSGDL